MKKENVKRRFDKHMGKEMLQGEPWNIKSASSENNCPFICVCTLKDLPPKCKKEIWQAHGKRDAPGRTLKHQECKFRKNNSPLICVCTLKDLPQQKNPPALCQQENLLFSTVPMFPSKHSRLHVWRFLYSRLLLRFRKTLGLSASSPSTEPTCTWAFLTT